MRISLHQGGEIVVVKLIAPVRVIAVLKMELLSQGRCQGYLAAVLAHGAAQGARLDRHARGARCSTSVRWSRRRSELLAR